MPKTTAQRVKDSFSPDDRHDVFSYMNMALIAYREWVAAERRAFVGAFLAAAAFELISHGSVTRVSLGPVELTSASVLVTVLPTVVAWLCLDASMALTRADELSVVHTELFRLWNAKAVDNNLDVIIEPRGLWVQTGEGGETRKSASVIETFGVVLIIVGLGVAPLVFEIHAFSTLFEAPHTTTWFVGLNAVGTSLILVVNWWIAVLWFREPE